MIPLDCRFCFTTILIARFLPDQKWIDRVVRGGVIDWSQIRTLE